MAATRDATWELVLKRNPVERLKQEKSPLGILGELPALIASGYERMAEEDVVRLKWWGLYHDKPKVGTFMLRIKLPGGRLTPAQLRAIGEISAVHGRGDGELTTRQNVQLHWIQLAALPDVFERLEAAGLTTAGACGDTVRNVTGCPVAGIARDELFDATPVVEEAAAFFYGHPDYSDLPRKHKITISACRDRCNAPGSTASPSSASCTKAVRGSRCSPAAGSPRSHAWRATSASSCPERRRSTSCGRSSTRGART